MTKSRENGANQGSQPTLIAIGGHEDRDGEMAILRRVAREIGWRRLVVATVASEVAGEMWRDYREAFGELGVRDLVHLHLDGRPQGDDSVKLFEGAGGVFFTGGDQL